MWVCVCVCMCVYIFEYACNVCVMCACVCLYVCVRICVRASIHARLHVCMSVCMCLCMYSCSVLHQFLIKLNSCFSSWSWYRCSFYLGCLFLRQQGDVYYQSCVLTLHNSVKSLAKRGRGEGRGRGGGRNKAFHCVIIIDLSTSPHCSRFFVQKARKTKLLRLLTSIFSMKNEKEMPTGTINRGGRESYFHAYLGVEQKTEWYRGLCCPEYICLLLIIVIGQLKAG